MSNFRQRLAIRRYYKIKKKMEGEVMLLRDRCTRLENDLLARDMKISDLIKENKRLKNTPKHRNTHPHKVTCDFCDNVAETINPLYERVCYKHRRTVECSNLFPFTSIHPISYYLSVE